MYTTCLFCHSPLGANDVVEHFPVGRRLAFDGAKGRLWVVCRRCGQWNLTPLEERWEAIEECERFFRGTRLRVSTDNIGLARLAEGLTLVRIGRPQRPEFAAWRYGDQFGRRRRRQALVVGAGAVVTGGVLVAGPVAGLVGGGVISALNYGFQAVVHYRRLRHVVARIPMDDGEQLRLSPIHVGRARLVRGDSPDGWALSVAHHGRGQRLRWSAYEGLRFDTPVTELSGEAAIRAARKILPHVNASGAGRSTIRGAVRLVEEAGSPERYFAIAAGARDRTPSWKSARVAALPLARRGDPDALRNLPTPVRLALEMAAHEDIERQALEGELARLEQEWRDAEEIAAIADDMFLPANVEAFLEKHRG